MEIELRTSDFAKSRLTPLPTLERLIHSGFKSPFKIIFKQVSMLLVFSKLSMREVFKMIFYLQPEKSDSDLKVRRRNLQLELSEATDKGPETATFLLQK